MNGTHMRTFAALAITACAAALLGGCGTRISQGSFTELQSGKKVEVFRYEEAGSPFGLKEAGEDGDTIVEPAWSRYTWGGGVIYVQPTGMREWVRVLGDGKQTDDRWDSVACFGQDSYSMWVRKRGGETSVTDLALAPITLRTVSGPGREMLAKAKAWTPANLGNIGTQGYILRVWSPLDVLAPEIGKLDQPAAEKAWFFDTYAQLSNLALQTYYHTEGMNYTNHYFGGYVKSMHRVVEAYSEGIRLNAGADKALDPQMRRNRIVAIFTVMAYDKEPVRGTQLEKLVELANEDFTALEADPANAPMIAAYTAELQKLIAKRSR